MYGNKQPPYLYAYNGQTPDEGKIDKSGGSSSPEIQRLFDGHVTLRFVNAEIKRREVLFL
jgi:hypothetical protein